MLVRTAVAGEASELSVLACESKAHWGYTDAELATWRGVGRMLLAHLEAAAAASGATTIEIDADPNAEAFYLHLGAQRVGKVAAPTARDPQRVRPLLRIRFA